MHAQDINHEADGSIKTKKSRAARREIGGLGGTGHVRALREEVCVATIRSQMSDNLPMQWKIYNRLIAAWRCGGSGASLTEGRTESLPGFISRAECEEDAVQNGYRSGDECFGCSVTFRDPVSFSGLCIRPNVDPSNMRPGPTWGLNTTTKRDEET